MNPTTINIVPAGGHQPAPLTFNGSANNPKIKAIKSHSDLKLFCSELKKKIESNNDVSLSKRKADCAEIIRQIENIPSSKNIVGSAFIYKEPWFGKTSGIMIASVSGEHVKVAYLVTFSTKPNLRVGAELMAHAINLSEGAGKKGKLKLTSHGVAVGFYTHLGFTGDGALQLDPKNNPSIWIKDGDRWHYRKCLQHTETVQNRKCCVIQ